MALTISDTLASYPNDSVSVIPSPNPFTSNIPTVENVQRGIRTSPTNGSGAFTALLPWPSQSTPHETAWTLFTPDSQVYTGQVPEGVSGPVSLATLVSTYGWKKNAYNTVGGGGGGTVTSYPAGSYNYLIYIDATDSNKVKARNGFTGAIDYSNLDAATTINAAITNLPAAGGTIHIMPGDYLIYSPIIIDKSYVTLMGQGTRNAVQFETPAGPDLAACLYIGNTNQVLSCRVDGIFFEGHYAGHTTGSGVIIRGNDCTFTNCRIQHFIQDGLRIETATGTTYDALIFNCYSVQNGRDGYVTTSTVSDTDFIECRQEGGNTVTPTAIGRHGWNLAGGSARLIACHAYYNVNNGFNNNSGTGVYQIIGGEFESNTANGIFLESAHRVTIIGAEVYTNGSNDIYCNGGSQITIANCMTYSTVAKNISFHGTTYGIATGNTCWNGVVGIQVDNGASQCLVAHNTCQNTGTNSIVIDASSNNEIHHNIALTKIAETTTADFNRFFFNYTLGGQVSIVGAHTILRGNKGWVTEASGTATIAVAGTSVVVTHGMNVTPARVLLTPTTDPQQRYWVSAKTATTFTISVSAAIATSAVNFDWLAHSYDGV